MKNYILATMNICFTIFIITFFYFLLKATILKKSKSKHEVQAEEKYGNFILEITNDTFIRLFICLNLFVISFFIFIIVKDIFILHSFTALNNKNFFIINITYFVLFLITRSRLVLTNKGILHTNIFFVSSSTDIFIPWEKVNKYSFCECKNHVDLNLYFMDKDNCNTMNNFRISKTKFNKVEIALKDFIK